MVSMMGILSGATPLLVDVRQTGAGPTRPRRARATGTASIAAVTARPTSALWRIVMVRIAHDPQTTAYFERRVKEGRSKRDVIRLLKRYVARELHRYVPRG